MSLGLLLGSAWGVVCVLPVLGRVRAVRARERAAGLRPGSSRRGRRDPRGGLARGHSLRRGPLVRVLVAPWAHARGRERARAMERALPLALDVLTMAARAGYTPRLALTAAARWSPPAIATVLAAVEARCSLGASLADALTDVARDEPVLVDVAEALVVAERSGAPMADLLARLADDARHALRRRSEAHARRVPVRLLFPLVFLVLPAFGLLTVVPTLASGLRSS